MVGIAAVVSWDGDPSAADLVQQMLSQVPHRGSRRQVISPQRGVCLGMVSGRAAPDETPPAAPDECPPGIHCVADTRLDNREELQALLGGPVADAQLLAA